MRDSMIHASGDNILEVQQKLQQRAKKFKFMVQN